jgi:hypothetical protein
MKKILTILLPVIVLVLMTDMVIAQVTQQWVARFNSNEVYTNIVIDMEVDKMGNVYILGYNDSIFTIKYNNSGATEWIRKYKGPSQFADRASDMVIDDSGNVYVTGMSLTNNQSPYYATAVVIKYSPTGDELWTKRFLNSDSIGCAGKYVLIADSNNIYLTAECSRAGFSEDITALKISPDGEILWEEYFSGPGSQNDDITYSTTDKIKNLYIAGTAGTLSAPRTILMYDVNGNLLKHIKDTLSIRKILVDVNYNLLTSGNYTSPVTRLDIFVSKYDSTGNNLWISTYHHASFLNNDIYRDFTIDEFGNSYVTGVSAKGMELAWDIVTIKYNQYGDSVWVQRYDSIYNSTDDPSSIAVDNNRNVFVTGSTNFNLLGNTYITICYDSTGNQKFVLFYNNNLPFHNHEAKIIKTGTAGNFFVTGISQNSNGENEVATIKYNIVTSIHNLSNEIPVSSKLYQNYPNPFNPFTIIRYELNKAGIIELTVYDILGKKVTTLFKRYGAPGEYVYIFNPVELSSGIYYYRLSIDGEIRDTKLMSYIK